MDTNRILMIDPATRKIEVPEKERLIGVYQDHDTERKYFKCPRIVGDNVDLSQHRIYVNYVPSKINGTFNEDEEVGSYLCEDVVADGDYVTFSWKISENVTREAGYIAFSVYAKKADADGKLKTKWHTTPAIGNVLDTLPDGDQIVSRYPDIIEQIMERLDRIGEIDPEQIAEAVSDYMTENPVEETDPTVPDWAKQPEKPTYTAEEVGALPAGTKIPSKTSDLQNDSGFLTQHQDLSGYALKSEIPKVPSDIGAESEGTAESKVSEHNVSDSAHNDIRLLVQGLAARINALADSDDATLDQMSEVVAYIKSNKALIDAITTSKVNVSDIIDNLTTNASNKPLSAAQGVKLKALIDAIAVPTKLSELENDSGYAKTTDIPDKLPNPQKLTFSGAVTAEYDGSGAVTVTIPEGSGGSGGIKDFETVVDFVIEEEVTNILIPLSDEVKNKIWNAHFIEIMVHVIASSNEEDTNTGNLSVAFRSSKTDDPSEWMTNGWYNGFLVQEATNAVLDSITNWKKYAITWALAYADTSINMSNSIYIKTHAQNQDIIYSKFDYNKNVINSDFLNTVKALAVWSSAPNFGVGTRIILRVM